MGMQSYRSLVRATGGDTSSSLADRFGDTLSLKWDFDAAIDGVTDDATALERAVASGRAIDLGSGVIKLSRQITFPTNVAIYYGDITLDFSAVASAGDDFPDSACVYFNGGDLTALADLNGNVAAGDASITLSSAPTVSEDDIVIIHNPTDGSFNGARTYYRAGEYCKVKSLSDATISLFDPLIAAYTAAAVDVYKFPNKTARLCGGRFKVIGTTVVDYGIRFRRLRDLDASGVEARNGKEISIGFDECYNVAASPIKALQTTTSGNGTDYGVAANNCQKVRLRGEFSARRHGFVSGGAGTDGISIPCRFLDIGGTFSNVYTASEPTVLACNAHGNTEYFHFHGTFTGGASFGGNHGKISGHISTNGSDKCALTVTEPLGLDFDASGVIIEAPTANPGAGSRGIIDVGGNTDTLTDDTTKGGHINLSGATIRAPSTTRLFVLRNAGYVGTEKIVIDLRGAVLLTCGGTNTIRTTNTSGTDDFTLLLQDFVNIPKTAYTLSAGTKVINPNGQPTGTKPAATTLVLDNVPSEILDVTGNTQIDAITLSEGQRRFLRFTGTPQITHGASLVLPTAANITAAAGDVALVAGYASSVVRCLTYTRADGTALA